MIPASKMRLLRRLAGTAAVIAVSVMLVVIYIRSSGKGGQVTLALPASATRSGGGKAGGGGAASASRGGSAAASSNTGGQAAGGGASSGSGGGAAGSGSAGTGAGEGNAEAAEGSGSEGAGAGSTGASAGPPLKNAGGGANGTFTGPVIHTIYGPVQVAVAEEGGKIVDVKAVQVPTEHALSLYISERVTPLLRTEALRAQSAEIGIVSGATFTSEGYASSLQKVLSHIR